MELNRDQIIKALECCGVGGEIRNCTPSSCPYYSIPLEDIEDCCDVLARDALALIKELIEENEMLRADIIAKEAEYDDMLHQRNSVEKALEAAKADTVRNVRKMKLRFKDELSKSEGRLLFKFELCKLIDQIEKEILEE